MEICSKCNNEFDGNFCPCCGEPSKEKPIVKKKQGVTSRGWFVILMLLIFFPLGLFFMWKNGKFPVLIRVIITVVGTLMFIGDIFNMSLFSDIEKDNSDEYISMVQASCYPGAEAVGMDYEEAFDLYFTDGEWTYFKSEDDEDIVQFVGNHSYLDFLDMEMTIQFVVEDDTYYLTYMDSNGVQMDEEEMDAMMQNIFLNKVLSYFY